MRRRFFQFSLRTLILGVIVYASLWLLTLKVGGATLARHYAAQFKDNEQVAFRENGTALHVMPRGTPTPQLQGGAVAYAPFILTWKWDVVDSELQNPRVPNTSDFEG